MTVEANKEQQDHDATVNKSSNHHYVASGGRDCGWVGHAQGPEQAAWDELHDHIIAAEYDGCFIQEDEI